jgi:cbb3-type cytochrome c oxidase subunit III
MISLGRHSLGGGGLLLRCALALLIASIYATSAGPAGIPPRALSLSVVEAQGPDVGTDAQRASGKTVYDKNCAQCHGEKGDGAGYATPHLSPRPRDFTTAKFKVRTTGNGALPTHQDLVNIIRRGMPYTSMPAWPTLSDTDVSNLAYYIKSFSADFANAELVPKTVELPSPPASTPESIETGKKLYAETGCLKCHGNLGRGDGPSAPTLTDDLGVPIRAANLTQNWTFRGGPTREDIFRTMSTGLNGTPMPSFADSLSVEQRWAITDFILSLSGTDGPGYTNLVVAKPVQDAIDLAKGAASFESAPVAHFPIIGQIMEPGRAFHPPATQVSVQAIYDAESIALLVRWHDMGADKTGKNDPSLQVPIEEEEASPGPVKPSATDPFGDAVAAPAQTPADPFAEPAATSAPASEFSDAVAIQIPTTVPTGARKPYFLFGDATNSVDLWYFDLSREAPLQFTGRGSADITPNDTGDVTGVASYDQGEWSVIFKRPLRPSAGAAFSTGTFLPIAFSVWDGFSRERGNRRGLTAWYSVYLEPENVPSAIGPMIRIALIILIIELAIIGWVRRQHASRRRESFGESNVQEHLRPS